MAETDVVAEVPEVAEAAPAEGAAGPRHDDESRYVYDESLLIRVKGRVKRPAKPDEAERKIQIDKLQAEITKHSDRIKEIKQIVEERRAARTGAQAGNKTIIGRLQGLRNEFQTVLRQKQLIREELQHVNQKRDVLREQQRNLREDLRKNRANRNVTIDNLDDEIRQLEYKLAHESVADPRKLENEIRDLNALRPKLRDLASVDQQLKDSDDARKSISQRLADCDAVLQDIKTKEEGERSVLDERNKDADGNTIDIPTLNAEKQESWEIIQALRDKITEIRNEFNAKYQEYIKLDKNFNAYMRNIKHQEYLERQKQREARAADENEADPDAPAPAGGAAAASEAVLVEPFAAEIFTIDQLVTYLRKLLPADASTSAAKEEAKAVEAPQGMKLLKKQEDEFMIVAKKKPQQGKKGAPAAEPVPAAPKSTEPPKRKLNHTLEILKTFMQFGIEVPQTTAELGSTIEKAEAKKVEFLERRKKGKEAPKEKKEKKEAAKAEAKEEEAAAPAPAEPEASSAFESAAAPAPASNGSHVAEEPAAPAPAAEAAEGEGKKGKKKKGKGEEAAAAPEPAKEEVPAAAAPAANGDSDVGVSLEVDKLTQSVSMRLRVSEDA